MINVAIVEDEKSAADVLLSYLDKYTEATGVEFHSKCFENPIVFLTEYTGNYDLVLLDIELPDMNGMEAAKKIREWDKNVTLIFVTNMAQYAIKGYEVGAMDFIVKPVTYYDFSLKLGRAVESIRSRNDVKIPVTSDDVVRCLTVTELTYIEVIKHEVIYHLADGSVLRSYGTLKKIEEQLLGAGFAKCNHCYLVNLRYVTELNGNTVLVGKDELQISHPKRKNFLKALNDYLGERM